LSFNFIQISQDFHFRQHGLVDIQAVHVCFEISLKSLSFQTTFKTGLNLKFEIRNKNRKGKREKLSSLSSWAQPIPPISTWAQPEMVQTSPTDFTGGFVQNALSSPRLQADRWQHRDRPMIADASRSLPPAAYKCPSPPPATLAPRFPPLPRSSLR
jgi:hypothetical protein